MMQRQPIDSLRQTKHCCKDLSHCAPACNIRARCFAQCNTSSGINQSLYKMHQQPATQQVKRKRVARAHAHEARAERAAKKDCFCTSTFHSEMHPATRFQNLTHLRHTRESQKQFDSSRFDIHFGSILSEIKVQTMLHNGNI